MALQTTTGASNGTIYLSTVPTGKQIGGSHDGSYLVTVHVAPWLNTGLSGDTLTSWPSDIVSGKLTFSLVSSELTSPIPATLDTSLIHPELWIDFLGDSIASSNKTVAAAAGSSPPLQIGFLKVNLKDTLDNAHDFYNTYIGKADVTDPGSVSTLYENTTTLSDKHSVFARTGAGVKGASQDARSYLKDNLGKNLAATRLFGNVNIDAAFPAKGTPVMLSQAATDEINKIHDPQKTKDNARQTGRVSDPSSRQHVIHHINRLRSVSRKAPANISQSSLDGTATASGRAQITMNFSQRISLLQGMPTVMEVLGLVLVFYVPGNSDVSAIQKLKVVASYNGTQRSYSNMTIVSPWTAVNSALFLPQPQPPAPAGSPSTQNPIIRPDNGYIDVSANYWMGSLQPESAAGHMFNFANRATMRLNGSGTNELEAIASQTNEDYTHVVLPPSPHTDGLYVYQHGRQNLMRQKLDNQAKQLAAGPPTDTSVKYAEDLFHSFAVDMKDASSIDWSRLTVRNERYFKCSDMDNAIITATNCEHGVRSSGTRPTDSIPTFLLTSESDETQRHQIDETLFTWRGGSLAVMDSSQTSIPSQTKGSHGTQVLPWGKQFCGEFEVSSKAKIPNQVFGGSYAFALRPVYITGRARPFDPDAAAASTVPNAVNFLRNEMLLGPKLIKKADTGSAACDTQSLMFVSSKVENPLQIQAANQMGTLKVSGDIESAIRYIVPSACTANMAKRHGMPPDAIVKGSSSVPMKKKNKDKKSNKDGALPDTLPIEDDEIDPTTIYIPDPMCDGVRVTLFYIGNGPLPSAAHQSTTTLPYYEGRNWPDFSLHLIELQRGEPGSPVTLKPYTTNWQDNHVAPNGEYGSVTLVCTLPPGMTAVMELTPTVGADFRKIHAFAPPSTPSGTPALEDTTICRPTVLRLTHATNIPVTVPDFMLDGAAPQPSGTAPYIYDRSQCSTPGVTTHYEPYSTGKVSIEASWTEMVDTPRDSKNPIPVRLPQRAAIFSQQFPKLKATKVGADIGIVYDTDDSCPSCASSALGSTTPATGPTVKLPFSDTRYRRVELAMTGVSRYENVIAEKQHSTSATRKILYDFPSTAPPPVPNVEYILPTFEWQFTKKFHQCTQTRKCGLAVMLNRPWFSSGEGEQLAVLLPASSQCGPAKIPSPKTLQLPALYPPLLPHSPNGVEDTVSAWGSHPIWNFAETSTMSISLENASSCNSVAVNGQSFNFALFDPVYDPVEDRWYCNLSFSEPPVYGTLLRLILARYQPHSASPGISLSAPSIVDFALLNPKRVVQTRRTCLNSVEVTVFGVAPYDSGKLLNRFTVEVVTEKDHDTTEFSWQETDSPSNSGTENVVKQILWQGVLKFDPLATNTVVAREYEQFLPFEAGASQPFRDRLVYASSIDIPAYL
jgi:hypothetical protein